MREKKVLLFLLIVFLLVGYVSAIRVSPAKIEGNFKPEMEVEITYAVESQLDRELEFYIKGDLAEYMELSKTSVFKEGSFVLSIKLPKELEIPGLRRTYVGVRELIDEELAKGALGTAVAVEALILIHVPYPGKYLESSFNGHNVNEGEPITFELGVINRGEEDIEMKPRIEIYSINDEFLETLEFKERMIKSQESIDLKKVLNTTSYSPGEYYALSKIDYDLKTSEKKVDFKIGELLVEIVNHTKNIFSGEIQKFNLDLRSSWNDKIDGAYVEIALLNNSQIIFEFKTSPTTLNPWETKIVTGYLDTSEISPGAYDANATVVYYGRNEGRINSKIIQINIIEKESNLFFIILISSISVLVLLGLILFFKNGKKKRK